MQTRRLVSLEGTMKTQMIVRVDRDDKDRFDLIPGHISLLHQDIAQAQVRIGPLQDQRFGKVIRRDHLAAAGDAPKEGVLFGDSFHALYPVRGVICSILHKQCGLMTPANDGYVKGFSGVVKEMQASGEALPQPLSSKKFSGKLLARIPPDVHRRLALQAAEAGISLNRFISAKLAQ